jgi:hypothetical protein
MPILFSLFFRFKGGLIPRCIGAEGSSTGTGAFRLVGLNYKSGRGTSQSVVLLGFGVVGLFGIVRS